MPDEEAVFELTATTREVSATLPSGRTLVLKRGKKRATSDPDEIAIWRAAPGVQEVKKSKKPRAKKPAANQSAGEAGSSTEGK